MKAAKKHRERASSNQIPDFGHFDAPHDVSRSPNTVSRSGYEDEPHTFSAHTEYSSRFPTPTRTFSSSTSSFPSLTPTMTAPPQFPLTASPIIQSQPPLAVSPSTTRDSSTTLPSFHTHFGGILPSTLTSSLQRHHTPPKISGGLQNPVTTH